MIVVAAPFAGYLLAYLEKMGEAGYYRIPTSYLSVGLEDALLAGSLIVFVSLISAILFKYLTCYAPRKIHAIKYVASCLTPLSRRKEPCSLVERMGPGRTSVFSWALLVFAVLTVLAVFAGALALLFSFALDVLGLADGSGSVRNLNGSDLAFVLMYAGCLLLLLVSSFYLYNSSVGRDIKEDCVSAELPSLKNKHIVVGFFVALVIGGICYAGGYMLSSSAQHYLVSDDGSEVIIKMLSSDRMVVCSVPDDVGPLRDGDVASLEGDYRYAKVPEYSEAGRAAGYRWVWMRVEVER